MKIKDLTIISLLLTLSIVIGIAESFIPSLILGIKLGLANIVTVVILYRYNNKTALIVLILRILLVAILTGRLLSITFYMSLVGGMLAYISMVIFKLFKFNIVIVSLMGAIFHVIGQILISIIILDTVGIILYMPILLVVSVLTGLFNGFVAKRVLELKYFN